MPETQSRNRWGDEGDRAMNSQDDRFDGWLRGINEGIVESVARTIDTDTELQLLWDDRFDGWLRGINEGMSSPWPAPSTPTPNCSSCGTIGSTAGCAASTR